jgi:uncharacterized protein (UPF0333 family)
MPALPPASDFTGSAVTEGQFKTAMTGLRSFLNDLFGADGTKSTALATLGAATPADLQAARDDTEADKIAAQAAATAAQAAWSAALAANPALDPAFRMNPSTITSNQTIPTGYNAVSVGPLTIAENVEITIADGGNWTIA